MTVLEQAPTEAAPVAEPATVERPPFSGLVVTGAVTFVVGLWAAIVPFAGPAFGFNGDGAPAWQWSNAHLLLFLAPGILAALAGLLLISLSPLTSGGRGRADLGLLSLVMFACGAWLVIGPASWPLIGGSHAFFAPASPYANLLHLIGYSLAPGVVIAACAGVAAGWALRHHPVAVSAAPVPAAVPTATERPVEPSPRLEPVGPALRADGTNGAGSVGPAEEGS